MVPSIMWSLKVSSPVSKLTAKCTVYSLVGQGLVSDFKFMLMTPQGPWSFLGELRCINMATAWYPRGVNGMKGTDRRASRLCLEYESKLRVYEVRFHGAEPLPRGQSSSQHHYGPLLQRFRGRDAQAGHFSLGRSEPGLSCPNWPPCTETSLVHG